MAWSEKAKVGPTAGLLLSSSLSTGVRRHLDLDHLGTVRLVSSRNGQQATYHVYLPYGEESAATFSTTDTERMKFTGHERDLADPASDQDDLDYMHQRQFSPLTGRFLSVDGHPARPGMPQSWNRYAYGLDDPLRFVDPDGMEASVFDRLYSWFKDLITRNAPPPPVRTDPNAQALVEEGEVTPAQAARMSSGKDAALTQQGLNEAGAALGAGAVFVGLKAGEIGWYAGAANGFQVGASAVLESGTLNVNIFALVRISNAPNLKGLFTGIEQAATRAGAERLVVTGTFAKDLFKGGRVEALARAFGYSFEILKDGTVSFTKIIPR
jgi:RHS repeat-associated protein